MYWLITLIFIVNDSLEHDTNSNKSHEKESEEEE